MGLKQDYKLKVSNVAVYTNLAVKLKSRTTKEEANKEVERMLDKKKLFDGYKWEIEECEEGGINQFNDKLRDDIIERVGQEETEENIFWDGIKAHFELNVAHIFVETNLEVQLKSQNVEEAISEVNKLCAGKKIFEGYEWKISGCSEQGINAFDDQLQDAIINGISQQGKIEDCIEEVSS